MTPLQKPTHDHAWRPDFVERLLLEGEYLGE